MAPEVVGAGGKRVEGGSNGRLTALVRFLLCQSVSLKVEGQKSDAALVELLRHAPTVMHAAAPGLLAESYSVRVVERGVGKAGGFLRP